MTTGSEKRNEVRDHYAQVAAAVICGGTAPAESSADSTSCCCADESRLYPEDMKNGLPIEALRASRGCGNPLGEIDLRGGMTVLDLGSGGGIDCLIAAQEVGPTGKVYGLDMTDEMLALANQNKQAAGADNVEFVKGFIEDIPLPDNLADVITSNCVINLSTDKPQALREAFRVLKAGGQFMVADIIALKDGFDEEAGMEAARIFGCRSGVITEAAYTAMMEEAGFDDVNVRVFKKYSLTRMREKAREKGLSHAMERYTDEQLDKAFGGAFISGTKTSATQQDAGTRVARAHELHGKGFNCAQAVACACADLVGIDEMTAFKMTEGLGGGMGAFTETCGAVSGGCAIIGYAISDGPHNPKTKGATYKQVRQLVSRFGEQNGSTLCKELKGQTGGPVLRSCPDCVDDGIRMTLSILENLQ